MVEGRCGSLVSSLSRGVERAFFCLGKFASQRRVLSMALSLALAALCSVGFISYEEENRTEKLWIPDGTQAQDHLAFVRAKFPDPPRMNEWALVAGDGGVLSAPTFNDSLAIHRDVLSRLESSKGDTFGDLCYRPSQDPSSPCTTVSIFEIFMDEQGQLESSALIDSQDAILERINSHSQSVTADCAKWRARARSGREFELREVLGGIECDENEGVIGARAIRAVYFLESNAEVTDENERVDVRGRAWEAEFIEAMKNHDRDAQITWEAERSQSDAFSDAIGKMRTR